MLLLSPSSPALPGRTQTGCAFALACPCYRGGAAKSCPLVAYKASFLRFGEIEPRHLNPFMLPYEILHRGGGMGGPTDLAFFLG